MDLFAIVVITLCLWGGVQAWIRSQSYTARLTMMALLAITLIRTLLDRGG